MPDDKLKLLMQSLGSHVLENASNPKATVAILISETVKFRDKLKNETGTVLTVDDTRIALDALEVRLTGRELPKIFSEEQQALSQIYYDRVTLFGG